MRPVTEQYLSAVRGSCRMAARATVLTSYQSSTQPDGTRIPIISGDVRSAANSDIRSTLSLTTQIGDWSTRPDALLVPYGNEIYVERGIVYGNGTTEWVGLGFFQIRTVEQQTTPDGAVQITGADRMQGLADARLLAPRQFSAGTTIGAIFADLTVEVYPDIAVNVDDPGFPSIALTRAMVAEESRVEFLRDLVTSYGKIMYFDYKGFLVVSDPPDPSISLFTVNHGRDGVLIELSRSLSRDGVYNGVVVVGEAADTDPPVRAVAVDNNANSPTYWFGRFGQVPRFYSSPFIVTTEQAQAAANSILRKSTGLPYSADLTAVPNAALEPWDPIKIKYPGRYERHILETITIPLTAEAPLTASTREQLTVVVGDENA